MSAIRLRIDQIGSIRFINSSGLETHETAVCASTSLSRLSLTILCNVIRRFASDTASSTLLILRSDFTLIHKEKPPIMREAIPIRQEKTELDNRARSNSYKVIMIFGNCIQTFQEDRRKFTAMKMIRRPTNLQQYHDAVQYAANLATRLMQLPDRNCPEARALQLAIMQVVVTLSATDLFLLKKRPSIFGQSRK